MVPWRASEEGHVTPEVLAWYERLARGRPAVLVIEATGVRAVRSGPLLRLHDDAFIPGLHTLVETVRRASGGETRLLVQIIDFLAVRRRPERSVWFRRFFQPTTEHRAALATLGQCVPAEDTAFREACIALSEDEEAVVLHPRELEDLRFGARERVSDTHLDHIAALPQVLPPAFAAAAVRARTAGFDGVELHYAHAYTLASFLSRMNNRADGYGGSLEGRVRLPLEVFAAVRRAVGDDWTVGARFLGDEVIVGGNRIDDACNIAVKLAQAGLDFISISKGGKFDDARQPRVGESVYPYTGQSGHECMPTTRIEGGPFSRNVPLAAAVRLAVRQAGYATPVVGAGGLCAFGQMEGILERGEADLVAAARQSLADPDWWLKLRLGRGNEVRRCTYTNYCEGLDQRHKMVTCKLWDRHAPEDSATQISPDGRTLIAPAWTV
ncbi:MAG: NADH:flavin oxidoreductase [Planctomycetes bacterium]|nr:NADH:flavin oxidoreductase [Planctomycetota bacterium]